MYIAGYIISCIAKQERALLQKEADKSKEEGEVDGDEEAEHTN